MPKFEVSKASDGVEGAARSGPSGSNADAGAAGEGSRDGATVNAVKEEEIGLTVHPDSLHKNLYLYQDDMQQMPRLPTFFKSLVTYHTEPLVDTHEEKDTQKPHKKARLGVILGVYLPTIQHIFGVLMFVRLAWIVGQAGVLESFGMVFMCCLTTFVTAISMSAIATNGMVQAGGSYFMISRNLGASCGGAVGTCFYLANTFAVDLYILGAIEIFLKYMAPGLSYFGDIHEHPENNYRVYGTVVVIFLTLLVAVGVRFVQFFAPFSLGCVIISIVSVYIGAFTANANTRDVWICMLGDRLLSRESVTYNGQIWCTDNETGPVYQHYCGQSNSSSLCDYFQQNKPPRLLAGIPGITSGVFIDNAMSSYLGSGEVTPGVPGNHKAGEITSDLTVSFVLIAAIYFPSVTGIMTGSNMSGDLKDPQKSIPIGTILAQLTCSFVYLTFVLLFGATCEGALLRDKFGESLGGSLLVSELAWPHYWVILVGAFCSTVGAALQCLTSAPRLLQAIARDNIIPFLRPFEVTNRGEPLRALVITAFIAELGILIASLDYVAPVIDVFFLMCYGFVNFTCALQTLQHQPSWRPRFKYYHWSLSVIGVILNLALSILAGWYYALAAFAIAGFIYKYVEYKGAEKEWGDGIQGLSMSMAQQALLNLEEVAHTKNWRPQILVLCKLDEQLQPKYMGMCRFASQLKAGKGLTIMASVLKGNFLEDAKKADEVTQNLRKIMTEEKVRGFAKVMIAKDVTEGMEIFVQTVGLGGMSHNTVVLGWPYGWKSDVDNKSWKVFLQTVRAVVAKELALLVPRGIENFPDNKDRVSGHIDIWWIVHDGGMLILLSYMLKQHKVWKNCKLRIITAAYDNSIQLEKDLRTFLYQLRIEAEVHVVEMHNSDVSAYTVERTLEMEKRTQMLKELHLARRATVQDLYDLRQQKQRSGNVSPDVNASKTRVQIPLIKLQDLVDLSHMQARFKEPSESHLLHQVPLQVQNASGRESVKNNFDYDDSTDDENEDSHPVHFTFSPADLSKLSPPEQAKKDDSDTDNEQGDQRSEEVKSSKSKMMRMHTAVSLNKAICNKSKDAALVFVNFPAPPAKLSNDENYMEYLEVLTEGLDRVVMVRGSGREVVTIYS